MAVAVDGHADAVQQRAEHDHDLGVLALHPVVLDHRRLDAALGQDAQEPQADVGHDLDVHPGVVVDPEPLDRVHVRDVPPRLQAVVGVDALEQRAQLAVPLRRNLDPHLRVASAGVRRVSRSASSEAGSSMRSWSSLSSCDTAGERISVFSLDES